MNNGTFNPYFAKLDFRFILLPFPLLKKKIPPSAKQNRCPNLSSEQILWYFHSIAIGEGGVDCEVPLQIQFLGGLIVFLSLVTSHVTLEKLTSSLPQRKG